MELQNPNPHQTLTLDLSSRDSLLSLASSPAFAVRSRVADSLAGDYEEAGIGVEVVFGVLFGLSRDLVPSVRRAALDGLGRLCGRGRSGEDEVLGLVMVDGVYDLASESQQDEDRHVRMAAIRLMSEWGQMVAANPVEGVDLAGLSDAIFLQICAMVRDMDMKVRNEAFVALGKVKLVSEGMLLQSLSKKVLGCNKGGKLVDEHSARLMEESKCDVSCAAGAFVHGLEDEFYEVRGAACCSLGLLSVFSSQFATGALNLLMDILNDDTKGVKCQTLQTFLDMARHDRLKVQDIHMHMFLGMFADISASIRHAARKVLCVMELPDLKMFKSSVSSLLMNLDMYPEDEEKILSVLFEVGNNHGDFTARYLVEFVQEVEPSCGEMRLHRPRVAAFLVLAIAAKVSNEESTCPFPQRIFSYAISFLGKIAPALRRFMNQDQLMAYLCHHSGVPFASFDSRLVQGKHLKHPTDCISSDTCMDLYPSHISRSQASETPCMQSKDEAMEPQQALGGLLQPSTEDTPSVDVIEYLGLLLRTVVGSWSLVKSNNLYKIQCASRVWLEELKIIGDCGGHVSAILAFISQYIDVILLIAEAWCQILPRKCQLVGMQILDVVLGKLEIVLRRMRYTFPGFSEKEELHVLELNLLCLAAKTCRVGMCSSGLLRRINATLSRMEYLSGGDLSNSSNFVKEIKDICCQVGPNQTCIFFPVNNLLKLFSLQQIQFTGKFLYIKADLQVPGNDSENPILFQCGLPVGITFQIKLYNAAKGNRFWLKMTIGGSVQHSFLDLSQFEVSDEYRSCTVTIPFYEPPNAAFFVLKALVVMECSSEPLMQAKKSNGGPKHECTSLCSENDIYFTNIG